MTFEEQWRWIVPLVVAALGGLAVGIEREWSARAAGEEPRFAGVRTFLLIALIGAISTQLIQLDLAAVGIVLLATSGALILVAYFNSAARGPDSTTEFAAVLVLASSALAGLGRLGLASAIYAFTALVLAEKTRIHSLVYRIRSEELYAGFRFAVLALVILPILPIGPFGPPPGFRPRELWVLVLLFSGVSFAGFIARRATGAARGYPLAGLLGGMISSTVLTLNFAKESQTQAALGRALALGVLAANLVLLVRVGILTAVMNYPLAIAALPYILLPFLVLLAYTFLRRRIASPSGEPPQPRNPLNLLSAIKLVLAFQAALYILKWVSLRFGSTGIMVTSALVGFTDVDTLLFMLAKEPTLNIAVAAKGLSLGILSNTVFKVLLIAVLGRGDFRWATMTGLALFAVALLAGILLW